MGKPNFDVERRKGTPVARCPRCGRDESEKPDGPVETTPLYQVIVACASCGVPFAALSRN